MAALSTLLMAVGLTPASFRAAVAPVTTLDAALEDAFVTSVARDEASGLLASTASLTIGLTALVAFSIAGEILP